MTDTPNDPPPQPAASGPPPMASPPAAGPPTAGGWPSAAKATTAVLAVVAVVAIVLAVIGFTTSDDDDEQAADEAAAELATATDRAEAAEAERDEAAAARDELAAELETTIETDAEARAELEEALAAAEADLVQAEAEAAEATARAEAAEARVAEIEDIAGQFPISLDSSLIPDDMPGTYSISYQEAYCDPGFVLCGSVPPQNVAEIYYDADQFLRIRVDGVLDAGLFSLDGSLYGITDTIGTLTSCSGAERRARVTITMYAGSVSVQQDGTRVVNDVNASITLDAPPDGEGCPGGIQFFASTFTKQG
jgi:hypothetical protein